MKKKILKISFCVAYALAIILLLCFAFYLIVEWLIYKDIIVIENVITTSLGRPFFPTIVREYVNHFLIPSALFAVIGLVLQKIYKKKINTQR